MSELPWVIYTRVSTEDQANGGISMDAQLTACRGYAQAKGWKIHDEICDPGASASTLNRPGMQRVLTALRGGAIAGVIVWRLDRMTRSLRDLLTLVDMVGDKKGLVSVTESLDTTTPMGRFTIHLLGAIAQWERETIGHRTSSAMQHARKQGYFTGGHVPTGCRVIQDGPRRRLASGPEADHITPIWTMILGGKSLQDVAAHLRQTCISGGPWTPTKVRALLLSPQVADVLVEAGTQATVRAVLAKRATPMRKGEHREPGARAQRLSPLAGLLRCPACDAAMVQVSATGSGGRYWYFRCSARVKGLCRQKDVRAEPTEKAVIHAVVDAIEKGTYRDALRTELEDARSRVGAARQERTKLTAERDQVNDRITDLALHGAIRSAGFSAALTALGDRLAEIDKRLAELNGILAAAEIDLGSLDLALNEMERSAARLPQAPVEVQAATLRILVAQARPMPDQNVVRLDLYHPEVAKSKETPALSGGGSYNAQSWLPGEDSNLRPSD